MHGSINNWSIQRISSGILDTNSTKTLFNEQGEKEAPFFGKEEEIMQSNVLVTYESDFSRLFIHLQKQQDPVYQPPCRYRLHKRSYKLPLLA